MNLDDMNDSVKKTDTLLESIKNLLKKHWGIILLLLYGALVVWMFTGDEDTEYTDDDDSTNTEQVDADETESDSESDKDSSSDEDTEDESTEEDTDTDPKE